MTLGWILFYVFVGVVAIGSVMLGIDRLIANEYYPDKIKVNKRLLACLHVVDKHGHIGACSKITYGQDNADMWSKVTVERIGRVGIYLDDGTWWPAHRVHEVHIQPVKEVD